MKSHFDLLYASYLALGSGSTPMYTASAAIALKYSDVPGIFVSFLSYFIKYLSGEDFFVSTRFQDRE